MKPHGSELNAFSESSQRQKPNEPAALADQAAISDKTAGRTRNRLR
jgi:hypothetical protein